MLLSGTYEHNIDAKNRLAIPSQVRDQMIQEGSSTKIYVAQGMQPGTLSIWPEKYFQQMADQLPQSPIPDPDQLAFEQMFFSDAYPVEPDSQGRILVPENLMKEMGISRQVVITGVRDHLAVWNRSDFARFKQDNRSQMPLVLQKARDAIRRTQERNRTQQ
jgi:MraZ protein